MTSPLLRRASLLLAAVVGVTTSALAAPAAVQADTGPMAYDCTAPGIGTQDLNFELDTNAPGTLYVGKTVTPTLNVRTVIPGWVIGLAKIADVYYADATGEITVYVNGKAVVGHAEFPYTKLPTDGADLEVNLPVTLPALRGSKVGTVRYTPGPIAATLNGYNNEPDKSKAESKGTIDASCTVKTTGRVIDTVRFVRSATATRASVAYAKAAKKVTAVARVTSRSGVAARGTVRVVLFKGKKKLAARTVRLEGGRATAVFRRVKAKGTYKVVTSYAGNAALLGSRTTRTFTRR